MLLMLVESVICAVIYRLSSSIGSISTLSIVLRFASIAVNGLSVFRLEMVKKKRAMVKRYSKVIKLFSCGSGESTVIIGSVVAIVSMTFIIIYGVRRNI